MLVESGGVCHAEGTTCVGAWRHEFLWWALGQVSCSMVLALECKMIRGGGYSWKGMLVPGCEKIVSVLRSMDPCHHYLKLNPHKEQNQSLNFFFFSESWRGRASGLLPCTNWGLANCLEILTWCPHPHNPLGLEMQECEAWGVNLWCQQK